MNDERNQPVTLEDLLRLKRVERPAPEFWQAFDRSLREKQLAALVEKRRWWRVGPDVVAAFARYHVALASSAVLAVTFFATQGLSPEIELDSPAGELEVSAKRHIVSLPAAVFAPAAVVDIPAASAEGEIDVSNAAEPALAESIAEPTGVGALFSSSTVLLTQGLSRQGEDSPSARAITANLAAAQAAEPAIARGLLMNAHGFEARAMPERAVEPLAQMTSPTKQRNLERFASAMAAAFMRHERDVAPAADIARRLKEKDFDDDAVGRIGATGASFTAKF